MYTYKYIKRKRESDYTAILMICLWGMFIGMLFWGLVYRDIAYEFLGAARIDKEGSWFEIGRNMLDVQNYSYLFPIIYFSTYLLVSLRRGLLKKKNSSTQVRKIQ